MVSGGNLSAVVIEGTDNLKTKYIEKKQERRQLMNIYGDECPLPDAYTKLAYEFIDNIKRSPSAFKRIAGKLYENFEGTAKREQIYSRPDDKWFNYVTDLFRGVDCANPTVDFSGRILIGNKSVADICNIPEKGRVNILGVAVAETKGDGPECIPEIASYDHLKCAFTDACRQAGINYRNLFLRGKALLEVYSCYPVVPMAFLLATGIADFFDEIEKILDHHEVTVTGGMNIAKAPWNNPVLNALIVMYGKIRNGEVKIGAVHGNGGLGYKQGVAIIGSCPRTRQQCFCHSFTSFRTASERSEESNKYN